MGFKDSGPPLPPNWVRLLVITPVVYVGCLAVTIVSPVLHLLLALIDLVDRKRWRFSRLGGLGIALCVTEFVGLTLALALWVSSGFGWRLHSPMIRRAHNRAFGWWLEMVTRALRFYLGFDLKVRGPRVTGPILALARHVGPGDMFLLIHTLIQVYRREMITVGSTKLLWDPFFDRLVRRTPSVFMDQDPEDPAASLAAITELAATMSDESVMIICPEGGNWTPRRWRRAIERLDERGQHDRAVKAAAMTHVLPPRPAGAIAAMQARPDLTVVCIAHVGLDDLTSLRALWKRIPLRRQVEVGYWAVDPDEIPSDESELSSWLFAEWAKVDRWIDDHMHASHRRSDM